MKIDPENSAPKYLQIKKVIEQYFKNERYKADQRIPSENELMTRFSVSRNTIRQALAELVEEGFIYKKQGSGTFFSGQTSVTQKQSGLIGVLTPRISYYIYPEQMQGIDEVAHQKGYSIVLGNADASLNKELTCLKQLLDRGIDGLLWEPTGGFENIRKAPIFSALQSLKIPVVLVDWVIEELNCSCVSIDDVQGGFEATAYLAEAGHTRIACIYPGDKIPGIKRYEGYRKALQSYGIEYDRRLDKPTTTARWNELGSMNDMAQELLELGDSRPSAMFFFNDELAISAYDVIRQAGLRIPDDISIVGFDNSEFGARADVPLTSVKHSKRHVGKWATEILFDEIEHAGELLPRQVLVKPAIAVRASVKNLKQHD